MSLVIIYDTLIIYIKAKNVEKGFWVDLSWPMQKVPVLTCPFSHLSMFDLHILSSTELPS